MLNSGLTSQEASLKTKKTPKNHAALKSFFAYMRGHKLKFVIVMSSFFVASVLLALVPIYIGKLTGALAHNPVQKHEAIIFTITLIALSTGHNLTWRLSEYLYLKLIKPMSYLYENMLFEKTIRQPYPYFVDKFTGKMSSYIRTISQEFHDFLDNLCFNYIAQFVGFIALAVILASINWQTGAIFAFGALGIVLVGKLALENSTEKERIAADVQSTKNGKIVDIVANFVNVKSFRTESVETQTVKEEQQKTIESASKSYVAEVILWASTSFFVRDLMWPLTISLNVYLFLHGQLTIAQLATMLSAILIFTTTIWDTIWFTSQFNLKMARAEEAHSYLFGQQILQDVSVPIDNPDIPKFEHQFTMQNLHFAYPDKPDVPVLSDISLSIKKGEKIGIVGKSGSGKTTLTKLLLDYYKIDKNELEIDGKPISTAEIAQLISYVPQDTSLFHRTIAENIAYAAKRTVHKVKL